MSEPSPPQTLGTAAPAMRWTRAPSWKAAWDAALYGPGGFFRRESPVEHFRTSVHASPLFAQALLRLLRAAGLDTVVDIGAGRGELLTTLHRLDPSLQLLGVEVADRPADLPAAIDWTPYLPMSVDGLVVANEWLDNVPCHVVEVDPDGAPRILHVDPRTGHEHLGALLSGAGEPAGLADWCARWWPLGAEPGLRAEVGSTRERVWADVVGRLDRGLAVAIDYGHTIGDRPPFGSLRSYRDGRLADLRLDGSCDVTADVAVDALAAAVADHGGSTVLRQREALRRLGVDGSRPDLRAATEDPAGYLRGLTAAGEAAELTAAGGLGDFFWVVTALGVESPLATERG
jgi:SAM-dependent MidA family methyltransferase